MTEDKSLILVKISKYYTSKYRHSTCISVYSTEYFCSF